MDCKKTFPTDRSNHRVHLDDSIIGILFHKDFEFLIGATDAAAFIDLELRFLTPGTEADFSGEIDVADFQKTVIDVVINSLLAAHQFVLVSDIDFMDRMPLLHKRSNDPVQPFDLLLTGRQSAS